MVLLLLAELAPREEALRQICAVALLSNRSSS
jgi:hypothetical protein